MKKRIACALTVCMAMVCSGTLADKAPVVQTLGSEKAASHLVCHIYARTDGWDGVNPAACPDEGCKDYGHVHCYGVRVTLWDTPAKGNSRVKYYPFGTDGYIGPETEFELIDVVTYKEKYYACVRTYENGLAVNSGFVNADYIGCDCDTYDVFEEIPVYEHNHGGFSLK